jgi:prophage regulatory protein
MRLLRITEVKEQTGLSGASIYKQIRLGLFPKGIKITERATAWSSEDVDQWVSKKIDCAASGKDKGGCYD